MTGGSRLMYIPSAMRSTPSLASLGVAVIAATLSGQPQTDKPALPKGQMPDLGRPTKVGDELPPFNFDDYFPGTWTFEWDVPEGPLGPSGRITGTTVYKPLDGRVYDAPPHAPGPGRAFTQRELV